MWIVWGCRLGIDVAESVRLWWSRLFGISRVWCCGADDRAGGRKLSSRVPRGAGAGRRTWPGRARPLTFAPTPARSCEDNRYLHLNFLLLVDLKWFEKVYLSVRMYVYVRVCARTYVCTGSGQRPPPDLKAPSRKRPVVSAQIKLDFKFFHYNIVHFKKTYSVPSQILFRSLTNY